MITTKPLRGDLITPDGKATDMLDRWMEDVTNLLNAMPQNNYTATGNPAVTDDKTKGYGAGSQWLNTTTGKLYSARSVAIGAAVWDILN